MSSETRASKANNETFLLAVLEHNAGTYQVDWGAVAEAVGYKSGAVASNRFRAIKKNFGWAKGEGLTKRAAANTANSKVAKSRKPHAAGAPAARKPAEKKAETNTKPRGASAKPKFVQKEDSDDNEQAEDEEPSDLMAGLDDENQGESDEASFEDKVTRGDYAESDSRNLSDGAVADLQRQIQEDDLQMQIREEIGEDDDAYYPDAVFEDAVEEIVDAGGHGEERHLYARVPVPVSN